MVHGITAPNQKYGVSTIQYDNIRTKIIIIFGTTTEAIDGQRWQSEMHTLGHLVVRLIHRMHAAYSSCDPLCVLKTEIELSEQNPKGLERGQSFFKIQMELVVFHFSKLQ